jgi:hypothetical protein
LGRKNTLLPNFGGFLPKDDAKLIGRLGYLNKTSDPFEYQDYQNKNTEHETTI